MERFYVLGGKGPHQTVTHRLLEIFNPALISDDPLSSWSKAKLSESGPTRKYGAIVAWHSDSV
eukprot:6252662-Prymnesium_polylepis.1